MEAYIILVCPHCNNAIQIFKNEINCAIFRHGVLISNGDQINPHTSKIDCDALVLNNLIYGCGKPFRIIKENSDIYKAEICEYI